MCYGIIQYNHIGEPPWNNTDSYIDYAIPTGIIFSVPMALLLTFAETLIRRFCTSKLLLYSILIIIFTAGWLWVTFEISSSYIWEYGNTWTDAEIINEMIFPCPFFTVLIIVIGFLLTRVATPRKKPQGWDNHLKLTVSNFHSSRPSLSKARNESKSPSNSTNGKTMFDSCLPSHVRCTRQ